MPALGDLMSLACLEIDAEWNSARPDLEPPSFLPDVWPRLESSGLGHLVLRHESAEQKRGWILWKVPIDQDAAWTAVRWNDLSSKAQRAVKEGTAGHLSIFFRQDLAVASQVLELYRGCPATVLSDLSQVGAPDEQQVLESLLSHATADALWMSFHSEWNYVVWFGDKSLITKLHPRHASAP